MFQPCFDQIWPDGITGIIQASKFRSTPWGISPRCPSWKRWGMKRGRLDCANGIPGPLAWLCIASPHVWTGHIPNIWRNISQIWIQIWNPWIFVLKLLKSGNVAVVSPLWHWFQSKSHGAELARTCSACGRGNNSWCGAPHHSSYIYSDKDG